jgi:hypothetical protein
MLATQVKFSKFLFEKVPKTEAKMAYKNNFVFLTRISFRFYR